MLERDSSVDFASGGEGLVDPRVEMFLLFSDFFDSTDPKKIVVAFVVTHGRVVFVHREVISFRISLMVLF